MTLAAMCSLARDSLLARCSSLQARPISHLTSLRTFKQVEALMHGVPQRQPPPPPPLQHHSCCQHAQHRCFAAAAIPQQVDRAAAASVEAMSQRSSGARPSDGGSQLNSGMAERLEELASVQSAQGVSPKAAWERQPSHRPARKQKHKGGGSRSKRRQEQQYQDASGRRPSPAAKSHPPPLLALASGKDPNAIRFPSLIHNSDIPSHAWTVMRRLKDAGYETFLVGGAVRDALLGGTPKDFDILTSARTSQVRTLFKPKYRCLVVGKRFPVAHVVVGGRIVEVSSFATSTTEELPPDAAGLARGPRANLRSRKKAAVAAWNDARQANALARDFTVNSLLYDPFDRVLYDYTGGVEDCKSKTLRAIGDPNLSFAADPARILRAIRLAARAGLTIEQQTASAIAAGAALVPSLGQGRLSMELAALFSHGAAAPAAALLWRFRLLDLLMPAHAAHMQRHKAARRPRAADKVPPPLLRALAGLDAHVSTAQPAEPALWAAALAAPLLADATPRKRGRPQKQAEFLATGPSLKEVNGVLRAMTAAHSLPGMDEGVTIGPLVPRRVAPAVAKLLIKAMGRAGLDSLHGAPAAMQHMDPPPTRVRTLQQPSGMTARKLRRDKGMEQRIIADVLRAMVGQQARHSRRKRQPPPAGKPADAEVAAPATREALPGAVG